MHLLISNFILQNTFHLNVFHHTVDVSEARSAVFSEQHSYWPLPLHETSLVTDITTVPGGTEDPLDDCIFVSTVAPSAIYSFVPRGGKQPLREILLRDVVPQSRSFYQPRLRVAALSANHLVVHEEDSNTLLMADMNTGQVQNIQLSSSMLETAAEIIIKRFGSNENQTFFRMCKDRVDVGQIVLWESGGGRMVFLDFTDNTFHSISAPLNLTSLHYLNSGNQWLTTDQAGEKWLLRGEDQTSCPNVLHPITQKATENNSDLTNILRVTQDNMSDFVLSTALNQQISSPSRILAPDESLAAVTVGFPELDASENEVYVWERELKTIAPESKLDPDGVTVILNDAGQVIRGVDKAPGRAFESGSSPSNTGAYLEVTDLVNHSVSYVPVPRASHSSPYWSWSMAKRASPILISPVSGQGVASVDPAGVVRVWQTGSAGLEKALTQWRKMIGENTEHLRLDVERESGEDVTSPKHGKEDPTGAPHVGGNTWAGGTGGRDTAGLGGKGGPYRLDMGHDVYQVSQHEKDAVPEEVRMAAYKMAQKAFKERLREIQMSEYDASLYERLSGAVKPQIRALRGIINSLQAKGKERQWTRHRTSGELDDTKLIEGLAGERNIYRQRREEEPEVGAPQTKPKRLRLLVDISGSMYRFNGHDGRLERELEATLMVMEAFEGFETKFLYDIYGHSGEDEAIVLVDSKNIPANNKERLNILKTMQAHTQFCLSGDHTLPAAKEAVKQLAQEESDEKFVILLSDANLDRYGIRPSELAKALTSEPSVNTYAIFIGSLGDQALHLTRSLPAGRSFVCLDLKKIPQILQQIFTSAMLK